MSLYDKYPFTNTQKPFFFSRRFSSARQVFGKLQDIIEAKLSQPLISITRTSLALTFVEFVPYSETTLRECSFPFIGGFRCSAGGEENIQRTNSRGNSCKESGKKKKSYIKVHPPYDL